jgi:predicted transcriptional regulator
LVDYKPIALVIVSDIREAIIRALNPKGKRYSIIKEKVNEKLGREISDGSFNWHIQKLTGGHLIEKKDDLWYLTDKGKQVNQVLIKIEETMGN